MHGFPNHISLNDCDILPVVLKSMNPMKSKKTRDDIFTLSGTGGGGPFRPPCRKIAISPELNLRWTSDQSVNSSLSVVVQ